MTTIAICQISCPCGKLFQGDVKKTDYLMRLHQKICKKGIKGTDTVSYGMKLNISHPKSHNGLKNKQQHLISAERVINKIKCKDEDEEL